MEWMELLPYVGGLAFAGIALGAAGIIASVHNTRLKIKHGYPLEGMWGQSLKPGTSSEAMERIKLLSQENAQLRAELGSIKDRLGNVERIVTDGNFGLTAQIEALNAPSKADVRLVERETGSVR